MPVFTGFRSNSERIVTTGDHGRVYTLMKRTTCFLLFLWVSCVTSSAQASRESWYQEVWCDGVGGKAEVKLPEGPRVDCVTKNHAIEMDFAHKWTEAIGQSLYYATLTGLDAGIVLILRSPGDTPHLTAAQKTIEHYKLPIKLWPLGP